MCPPRVDKIEDMSVRHVRAGLALYAALAALLLVVSRVESLASSASPFSVPAPVPDLACHLALHVRDSEGAPLTARIRITPASFREKLRLGQFEDVREIANAGELKTSLPSGAYLAFVSHGPEWSLIELAFEATAGTRLDRTITLAHEVSLEGWHGADLHVHTDSSRDAEAHGGVGARDLVAEDVELAAITDHNHIGALPGFESIAGAEVTTWAPEIGHFNAFPLATLPQWQGTNPVALFEEISRDPRVFVQINHPRLDDHIAYFKLGGFDGVKFAKPDFHLNAHGLEVWNGYDLARPERVFALLAEWRGWLAKGVPLTATGGSDSHGAAGHVPGYPRTYTHAARAAELAPQLRAGKAFVTNGPLLELAVNGRGPGETVSAAGDAPLQIALKVRAPSWMRVETLELWADESLAWTIAIPAAAPGEPLVFDAAFEAPVTARVLQAVAHGGSGLERLLGRSDVTPLAFTNPVYVAPTSRLALGRVRSRVQRIE